MVVPVVSALGGEAFPVTFSDENVHSFAWSADSHRIYFAHSQSVDGAAKGRTREGVPRLQVFVAGILFYVLVGSTAIA
jgi:hypothetical protein